MRPGNGDQTLGDLGGAARVEVDELAEESVEFGGLDKGGEGDDETGTFATRSGKADQIGAVND